MGRVACQVEMVGWTTKPAEVAHRPFHKGEIVQTHRSPLKLSFRVVFVSGRWTCTIFVFLTCTFGNIMLHCYTELNTTLIQECQLHIHTSKFVSNSRQNYQIFQIQEHGEAEAFCNARGRDGGKRPEPGGKRLHPHPEAATVWRKILVAVDTRSRELVTETSKGSADGDYVEAWRRLGYWANKLGGYPQQCSWRLAT